MITTGHSHAPLLLWRGIIFLTALTSFAPFAIADGERTVKVSVSVIDDKDKDIQGATVIVTPEGGTPATVQSDAQGNATATVTLAAAKFGEGWLRSAPTVTVIATKDSVSGQNTLTVRSKEFKDGKTAALSCTVVLKAPPPPVTAQLTVSVKDEQGNAVSGARINAYPKGKINDRIVIPPASQEDTNAQGLAHLSFPVPAGSGLDLSMEVSHEDMAAQSRTLSFNAPVPSSLPEQSFVLKKRAATGGTEVISVVVEVQSEGKALEGANVLIRDSSLGAVTGNFTGVTNGEGRATIAVWYASPDSTKTLPIQVSKNGYKTGKASVPLTQKQIGKTITGPTISLEKESKTGTVVTVNVIDAKTKQGIGGAQVTLDGPGYHWDNTNGSGIASFVVPETGTFEVRVTAESHRPFTTQVRVLSNERDKPAVVCEMEPKATKDEGEDVIDVTVLWNDTTDEGSKPAPLKGAMVKAGSISGYTDEGGKAALQGAFEEKQEVVVDAEGYRSDRQIVNVAKILHYSKGKGSATFTLKPDLSEKSPIRIIVDVQDLAGVKIDDATVEFYSSSGAKLKGGSTEKRGFLDFKSSEKPDVPLAELRKGISVNVRKTPEYKEVLNRSVPSNLLQPSLQAGRYLVQLDRNWSELEKALGALEARGAALKNEATASATQAKAVDAIVAKFPAAKGRVESILADLKKAQQVFDPKNVEKRCQEAAKLVEEIKGAKAEADKKEESLKKTIDEAIGLAAHCKSKADGDLIKSKHRDAIKNAGEVGALGKKAAEANGKLARLAEATKTGSTLDASLQEALDKIEGELAAAKKDESSARSQFIDGYATGRAIPGKRAALLDELNKLKTKFEVQKNEKVLPAELKTRIATLEQLITSISTPNAPEIAKLDDVMKPVLADLEKSAGEARSIVSSLKSAICTVQAMDDVVQDINSLVTSVTIELGAAAELPAKADACIAASQSPSPAADEVTVPDMKSYTDPSKMIAAATQAGLKPSLVASNEAPAADGAGIVVRQNPLANAKAKRGDPLTIFLSQKKVTTAPSPTPTPAPAATPSPKATDEVAVPPMPAGATVAEAKATLSAAGLVAGFNAKGGKPDSKDLEFKTTSALDPPAGTKVKRGSTVTVSIYQKYEPTASPTPTATAMPSPTVASGTMPNLIGLTLEQAVARLPSPMRIGSDEAGLKPPKPELAMTIFAQTPQPGTKFDIRRPPVVAVKRYGSAQSTVGNGPERFDGTYTGSYSGDDKGAVRFSVSGGVIAITSPGRGTGQISQSGAASISGSGADGASHYSFSGTFSIGSDGRASAGGNWTGSQSGFTGHGSWSASRR